MFGATPGVFENKVAAKSAADAYTMEENQWWIVVGKPAEINSNTSITRYRPCRSSDLKHAKKEGWVEIE